jgi:predicted ATPase
VAMVHGAQAQWVLGQLTSVEDAVQAQNHYAASLHHPYSQAWALTWGGMLYLHDGDAQRLQPQLMQGLQLAEQHGFAYVSAMATWALGWCQTRQGQLLVGIATMQQGLDAFKQTGSGIVLPFFQTVLAEALVEAGRLDEAALYLDDAWVRIEQGGERWYEAEQHRVRARWYLALPVPDTAQAQLCLAQALSVAQSQQACRWLWRAQADEQNLLAGSVQRG